MTQQENPFYVYAQLTAQIKELEGRREQLALQLKEDILEVDGKTMKTDYGTFTVQNHTTYIFPKKVQDAEAKLKTLKAEAIEKGTAKIKTGTQSLRFTPKKEDA